MIKLNKKNSVELKPDKVYLLKIAKASYDAAEVIKFVESAKVDNIKVIPMLVDNEKHVAINEDIAGELASVDWSKYLISQSEHILPHCNKNIPAMAAICSKLAVVIRNKIKEVLSK